MTKQVSSPKPLDSTSGGAKTALHRRYPTLALMREGARRRLPHFAFEYADGGAGEGGGVARNWAAFNAVEIVPRSGVLTGLPPVDCTLFGRAYGAPVGVAPMGVPSIAFPGADRALAMAAQARRMPYTLGCLGGLTIEEAAEIAPDVFWLQLSRMAEDDHRIGFDFVNRAEAAGAHALVLTMDTPVLTTRPREVAAGIALPFRPGGRMVASILSSPAWLAAFGRTGVPAFVNYRPYLRNGCSLREMTEFVRIQCQGAFSWEEVARYRDRWKRPLVVKGILHPEDAQKALALGVDGIVVSNHGGRQVDSLPASIDVLPAIAREVGGRMAVFIDSGVRSGSDVVRSLAVGADAAFVGKGMLWSLGAMGSAGPGIAMDVLVEEARSALGQVGARTVEDVRSLTIRHPGRYFAPRADTPQT